MSVLLGVSYWSNRSTQYPRKNAKCSKCSSSNSSKQLAEAMTTSAPAAPAAETPAARPAKKRDADYIPTQLRQFVFHSQDDFYVSRFFDPVLLAHLMFEGFLPIASEFRDQCFLLPKLHRQRCLLLLEAPEHIPKSVKKRGRRYKLVLNQDFDGVVQGCHEKHGIPWLYPPIVEGFRSLAQAGDDGIELFPGRVVRFFSVELRDVETGALAAGELGYTTGRAYTSLTGFSRVNGAGTVQLHALGRLLYLSGMKMWDLGMSMPYKMSLGAADVDRDDFLEHLYRWRAQDATIQLDTASEGDLRAAGVHVKALLDLSREPQILPVAKAKTETATSSHVSSDKNSDEDGAEEDEYDSDDEREGDEDEEDASQGAEDTAAVEDKLKLGD